MPASFISLSASANYAGGVGKCPGFSRGLNAPGPRLAPSVGDVTAILST
jgi:hypothetical protein